MSGVMGGAGGRSSSQGGDHPGFANVAAGIADRQGVSPKVAAAELAASTRRASPAAKRRNPRLNRVKG
jgi:hypothetical protein